MSWFNASGFTTLAKSALTQAQKTIDKALDIHEDNIPVHNLVPVTTTQSSVTTIQDEGDNFFAAFGLEEGPSLSDSKEEPNVEIDSPTISISTHKNDQSIWGSFTGSFFDSKTSGRAAVMTEFLDINIQEKQTSEAETLHQKNVQTVLPRLPFHPSDEDKLGDLSDQQAATKCVVTDNVSVCEEETYFTELDGTVKVETTSERRTKVTGSDSICTLTHPDAQEAGNNVLSSKSTCNDRLPSDLVANSLKDNTAFSNAEVNTLSCSTENSKNVSQDITQTSDASKAKECMDSVEKVTDVLLTMSDSRIGSTSLCSISSSSTTGESSSTLDESVGTLSALSEKDDHSSTTVTPEIFSDLAESYMPTILSTSWDIANAPPSVDHQLSTGPIRSTSWNDPLSPNSDQDILKASQITDAAFQGNTAISEATNKSPETTGFVCFMLEAAMVEEPVQPKSENRSQSPRSSSSTSSTTERSDPVKVTESEQNSGHTSGEEVETTTSSDIEIISSPSAGGESGCERTGSLSPIKKSSQWRRKISCHSTMESSSCQNPGSMRSESPASDTSSTKDGIPVQYSFPSFFRPDLSFNQINSGLGGKGIHISTKSEASSDESEGNQAKIDALLKKLAEVNNILEIRENKVLELNRENVKLIDQTRTLEKKLRKAEEVRVADNRDVSTLTKEFTERLSATENKLQQSLKEKDSLACELQKTTQELSTRVSFYQVEEIKKEKNIQIGELMQEGEKLSKQLLGYSNNVKKLRAKEKDNENHIKQQREKLEEQSRELDRIRKALGAKEEVEKNQIELIRHLTSTVQKYEKDLANAKSDLEDAQEKQRSMKVAMDSAYKELAELHRKTVERDLEAQEAALSVELLAKEELKACLEQVQFESRIRQENLFAQIEDLRMALNRSEEQASLGEDSLRRDLSNLQQRLQEAEAKNEALNQNVSAATKPLLKQIGNLQSTLKTNSASWDRTERNLTDKLNETQNQLAYTIEKELTATERYAELSSNVASLEAQNSLLRQEKTCLHGELTNVKEELHLAQEKMSRDSISTESMKQSFTDELSRLKREMTVLEQQLGIEKTVLEAEKRKNAALTDQIKEKITSFEDIRYSSTSPQKYLTKSSINELSVSSWSQDTMHDSTSVKAGNTNPRVNVYDSLRAGSATAVIYGLQSQLKLRDGDVIQLQANITKLERVKESMTNELMKLTSHVEELESTIVSLRETASQNEDLQQKYNALLQMYGEMSEEAEELKLDLRDVKDMYKAQIDELMRRKH